MIMPSNMAASTLIRLLQASHDDLPAVYRDDALMTL
jgi:hypothetical protein